MGVDALGRICAGGDQHGRPYGDNYPVVPVKSALSKLARGKDSCWIVRLVS
jgi:hypothetical protein